MMPVSGKYRDLGTMIEGKIEAGVIKKVENYTLMPNRETISISALYGETEEEVGILNRLDVVYTNPARFHKLPVGSKYEYV